MKKSLVENIDHFGTTHARWLREVNRDIGRSDAPDEWSQQQCFLCAYYVPLTGAFSEDWGVCTNAMSVKDGRATFEHDGCEHWEGVAEMWQES